MRNIMASIAVLGTVAVATVGPALAHPPSVSPIRQSTAIQQADWDWCGPRCWEHRREMREREWEYRRWAQRRRWEENRR